MSKLELLSPAGNLEKLKIAIQYGADAVYLAGENFSLRAFADNFTIEEMAEGIEYAHYHGKKVYITVNIFMRDNEIDDLKKYLNEISKLDIDGIIVSDPGVLDLVKEIMPKTRLHLSTQANCTSAQSAMFWYNQGIRRIVLARELSLDEIKKIRILVPDDLELEAFAHGAMCVSYSGRCLLSNYMVNRDSNRGECAQPCRWEFNINEVKRTDDFYPLEEDKYGTYIMNSKDLSMIEHLEKLIEAGITSVKIEGRMKSEYYAAIITRAYRMVIDAINKNILNKDILEIAINEIHTVSHRPYTTGFYLNGSTMDMMEIKNGGYIREYEFIGLVKGYDEIKNRLIIQQRNRFFRNDQIEIITPEGEIIFHTLEDIYDEQENLIETANHPKMIVYTKFNKEITMNSVIRKKI